MAADVVFLVALCAMAGLNLYFAPEIRAARVPMQRGVNLQPTWYAPKLAGLRGPISGGSQNDQPHDNGETQRAAADGNPI
jgi:hypothetical protein